MKVFLIVLGIIYLISAGVTIYSIITAKEGEEGWD